MDNWILFGFATTAAATVAVTFRWLKGTNKDSITSQPVLSGGLELPEPVAAPAITNSVSYISTSELPSPCSDASVLQIEHPYANVAAVKVVPDVAPVKQLNSADAVVEGFLNVTSV